jgi:hypothetical protein
MKRYTLRQALRKSDARTRGCDARIENLMKKVLPIIKRSKKNRPLMNSELRSIDTLRDVLTERIRIAALDAMIRSLNDGIK